MAIGLTLFTWLIICIGISLPDENVIAETRVNDMSEENKHQGGNYQVHLNGKSEQYVQKLMDTGEYPRGLNQVIEEALRFHQDDVNAHIERLKDGE